MIKRYHKLKGKDINFLFKKQKFIGGKFFSFFYFPQYKNKNFNQFSVQIPLKLSKKATVRNFLKRTIFGYIKYKDLVNNPIYGSYYKIFIVVNKRSVPKIKETIETRDKKLISDKISLFIDSSFNNLINKLGEE